MGRRVDNYKYFGPILLVSEFLKFHGKDTKIEQKSKLKTLKYLCRLASVLIRLLFAYVHIICFTLRNCHFYFYSLHFTQFSLYIPRADQMFNNFSDLLYFFSLAICHSIRCKISRIRYFDCLILLVKLWWFHSHINWFTNRNSKLFYSFYFLLPI